jgi:hypothetical protein
MTHIPLPVYEYHEIFTGGKYLGKKERLFSVKKGTFDNFSIKKPQLQPGFFFIGLASENARI